jgi:prepilin signal peptidase PulO-like enzyme (type II secretory pathway)
MGTNLFAGLIDAGKGQSLVSSLMTFDLRQMLTMMMDTIMQGGDCMPIIVYETLAFSCILIFAGYDIRHRRVPDRAIVLFCPVAMMAPFVRVWGNGGPLPMGAVVSVGVSALGAVAAFGIMLSAAMFSGDGAGVGGGDIKLSAVMGFIYGPPHITLILLVASFMAAFAAGLVKMGGKEGEGRKVSLPFVPFLAAGVLAATIFQAIK